MAGKIGSYIGRWVYYGSQCDPAKIVSQADGDTFEAYVVTENDHEGEVVRIKRGLSAGEIRGVIDDPELISSLEHIRCGFDRIRKAAGHE